MLKRLLPAGKIAPARPSASVSIGNAKHRLRLVRIRAHRFAGLHAYGTAASPPQDFVFAPSDSLSLLEGWNGSGKTSLINSMIWCLTGRILRPQRAPGDGREEFESVVERIGEGGATTTLHALTPVTPLPSLSKFMPAPGEKIPVDTWVELTFADEDGNELSPVRRSLSRTTRGKIQEQEPDLGSLGVDPIAFAISTTMPAMLQHLQLGQTSDLGRAVSQLTGLSDLIALQGHAVRASAYIEDKLRKRAEEKIAAADIRFNEAIRDMKSRVEEFPAMRPSFDYPSPSHAKTVETEIVKLQEHFTGIKAGALNAAKQILGETFDADNAPARQDLEASIALARGEISHLAKLQSAARLGGLGRLSDAETASADEVLRRIFSEAEILGALVSDPKLAVRKQLYAAVATWTVANEELDDSHCHLCGRPLLEQVDPVTGNLIRVHLEQARLEEPELLSLTVALWAASRIAKLADRLAPVLRDERDRDLPSGPAALLKSAICEELFQTKPFAGTLAALKSETISTFEDSAGLLPDYVEPTRQLLPTAIANEASLLENALHRVRRALSFAIWRRGAKDALVALFATLIGKDSTLEEGPPTTATSPLSAKLAALQSIVDGALPIGDCVEYCDRMAKALAERRRAEDAIANYGRSVAALAQLEKLGGLAAAQVASLQVNLEGSAARWRGKIYLAPVSGPSVKKTAMSATGVLEFQVGSGNISAPAQHVANASALRAALVGFFLAFREHVLKVRGGLELILLDDPQELLDEHNRGRMADVIVQLAAGTAQPVVTTYDRNFAMMVASEAVGKCAFNHLSIHGVNAQRDTLALGPAKRQLDEDRLFFERNIDDQPAAARYAATTRTYIETRLRDLFDDPAYPAYAASSLRPSLSDHLDYLRSLISAPPSALFSHSAVTKFVRHPGLAADSECYGVLNDAHHTPSSVSYGRVKAVATHLRSIASGVKELHRAFREWRSNNQLPNVVANDNGKSLPAVATSSRDFTIHPNLSAFSGPGTLDASQEVGSEIFSSAWFADKSLFYVRSDNFGFAIPKGYIAIVEAVPAPGRDRNLVIAVKKGETLARRLFRQDEGYALAAETPDPRESPPTKMVRGDEYSLHRVVGCLLLESVVSSSSREAMQVNRDQIADEIQAVYRLDKESAVPLALPGQLLLGGRYLSSGDISAHEGKLAAITLSDGSEVLKRIGASVSVKLPHLRHFETIGGLGQSVVLQTEEVEGSVVDVPVIHHARLAIGVIYEY